MIRNVNCTRVYLLTLLLLLFLAPGFMLATPAYAALACNACHSMPPSDSAAGDRQPATGAFKGNHQGHSSNSIDSCVPCHGSAVSSYKSSHSAVPAGSGARSVIRLTPALNNYSIGHALATYNRGTFFNQTSIPPDPLGTCTNVNCHFERTTPAWGTANFVAPTDCDKCHGAPPSGAAAGAAGSHAKHDSYYPGAANCLKCHPNNANFQHATSAGNRNLAISFAAAPNNGSGVYSGQRNDYLPSQTNTFGNCTATYCHSKGTSNTAPFIAPNQTATWGGTLGCDGCHATIPATGSHATHVSTTRGVPVACYKCHTATVNSGMAISSTSNHVNRKVDIAFDSTTTAILGKYSGLSTPLQKNPGSGNDRCDNVYCHSTAQGTNGSWPPTYSKPKWGDPPTGKCPTCHEAGVHTAVLIKSGSHSKHLLYDFDGARDSNMCGNCHWGAGFAAASCSQCHLAGGKLATLHVNHNVDVSFVSKFGGSYSGTPAPGDGYGSCSSNYCHSNGLASSPAYYTPTWGNTASGACGTCHGANAATPPASTPHNKHVGSAGQYQYACALCHAGVVKHNANSSTYAVISTASVPGTYDGSKLHVNKFRNVKFDAINPFGRYSGCNQSCNSTYCHSIGNNSVTAGSLPGVYNEKIYAKPKWTDVGPLACNACHGRSTSNGMPDYTNGGAGVATANSHSRHVVNSNIACVECHEKTTKSGSTIRSSLSGKHVDGTNHDVYFNLSGNSKLGTYDNAQKKCSSTYCHGAGPSAAWGSLSLPCNSCHNANSLLQGAHQIHIQTTAIASSYNNISGNVSTSALYRFSCAACHQPGSGRAVHAGGPANINGAAQVFYGFTSANRKGTYSYGAAGGSDNGFAWSAGGAGCATTYCHSNGQLGPGSQNGLAAVAWSTTASSGTCVQCHDTKQSGAAATTLSGKHDMHMNPTNNSSLGLGNGFGCVQCHAKTVSNNTTISNKLKHVNKFIDYSGLRAGSSSRYSTATKLCSNIYCHSNGNPGSIIYVNPAAWNSATTYGCNGCHGTGNANTGAPDYANGGAGSNANNHAKHVTVLNISNTTGCTICHVKTASMTAAGKFKDYTAALYHLSGTPNVIFDKTKAGASASFSAGACSNIICHGSTTPVWGQTSNCDYCHPIATLSSGHQYHVDLTRIPAVYLNLTANRSSGSVYDYGCSNCHPLNNPNHANGVVVLDLRPVAGSSMLRSKNSASNTVTGPVGTASGTTGTTKASVICNNVYCHSNGGGSGGTVLTTPTYYATPDWYGSITAAKDKCSMCHGNTPNSTGSFGARIGSPHYNTSWIGYANTSSGHTLGLHDKNIYKGGMPYQNGLLSKQAALPSAHGNSTTNTTLNCNTCHNKTVTAFGNDKNNVCVRCHYSGNSLGAQSHNPGGYGTTNDMQLIANTAFHVNGAMNVSFRNMTGFVISAQVSDASWPNYSSSWRRPNGYKSNSGNSADRWNPKMIPSYSAGTCFNVACHNGQSVRWNKATADPRTGGIVTCASCHTDF